MRAFISGSLVILFGCLALRGLFRIWTGKAKFPPHTVVVFYPMTPEIWRAGMRSGLVAIVVGMGVGILLLVPPLHQRILLDQILFFGLNIFYTIFALIIALFNRPYT